MACGDAILADQLTTTCRQVDPESTDQMLESVAAADVVRGEESPLPEVRLLQ